MSWRPENDLRDANQILKIMTATLIINKTGKEIKVHATTDHPSSSYGKAVWVDDDNNAYLQVGLEQYNTMYSIVLDEPYRTRRRVGGRIATLRKEQNLTIRDLAERTGINISNLSSIENGKMGASIDTLSRIAHALGTSVEM